MTGKILNEKELEQVAGGDISLYTVTPDDTAVTPAFVTETPDDTAVTPAFVTETNK